MDKSRESPEENSLFGRWARWAVAPYCEFKDDRARLFALVARDLRKVFITALLAFTGISLPWSGWLGLFLG
jgi:hypothetical protein